MSVSALPSGCRIIDLAVRGDERGSLVAVEPDRDIPFEIRRAYYIFDTREGVSRGFHAHHRLNQLLVAVSGSCRLVVDDGREQGHVVLDRPNQGLIISGLVWREMHDFSADCVLLVMADQPYDPADYIRNHEQFAEAVRAAAA